MNGLRKSSGLRVSMLIAPATPPSTRSAVALLWTVTLPTSSDGSSVKLTLRPTVWNWSRMNQSPVATLWPLISVCVRLGLVPRMLTRSFSSKPPSPPAAELVLTPGMRWIASATFLSGILPMSSAVTTSTTESALRLAASDCSRDARMPVTVTTSRVVARAGGGLAASAADAALLGACWACAANHGAISTSATAWATGVGLNIMRGLQYNQCSANLLPLWLGRLDHRERKSTVAGA